MAREEEMASGSGKNPLERGLYMSVDVKAKGQKGRLKPKALSANFGRSGKRGNLLPVLKSSKKSKVRGTSQGSSAAKMPGETGQDLKGRDIDHPIKIRGQDESSSSGDETTEMAGGPGGRQLSIASMDEEARPWYSFLNMLREHYDSLEFVYLAPLKTNSLAYNPYDLEVVNHSDIDEDHFYTMSAAGVTHFIDGQAEFTPLDQWKREYHLYNQIINLDVFRQYKLWKGFATWKKCVRHKKTRHCKQMLERNLFILNPVFQKSLLKIRNFCHELSDLTLHDIDTENLYALDDFYEKQVTRREVVRDTLGELFSSIVETVEDSCSAAIEILEERLFGKGSEQEGDFLATATEKKMGKNTQRIEDENKFSYAITAAKRSEQRKLFNYIRLADYMICDTLHDVLIGSVGGVLDVLGHPSARLDEVVEKQSSPIFEIEILMDEEDELIFKPSVDDFQAKAEDILEGFLDVMGAVIRLPTHDKLKVFIEQNVDIEISITIAELVADEKYHGLASEVKDSLALAFEDAEEFKTIFAPYRDIVLENRDVNSADMRKEVENGQRTLEIFRDDVLLYQKQLEEITALSTTNDNGIIRVNMEGLKNEFLPSPQRCLHEISELLPRLASESYGDFVSDLRNANSNLSSVPSTVEEFVDFLEFLAKVSEERENYESRYVAVVSHYDLIEEFSIKVPDIEHAAYQTLGPDFSNFKNSIEVAEASKDEYISKFSAVLENDCDELTKTAVDIRLHAQNEIILDEKSDTQTVWDYTKDLVNKVADLKQQAKTIQKHQRLFRVTEARFDDLDACSEEVDLKHSLWDATVSWSSVAEKWQQEQFEKLDVPDMEEKIMKYSKLVFKCERGLPMNKVVDNLKDKVYKFKDTLPIVQNLRNEDMKERHWEKVQEVMNQELVRDESFTLGLLMSFSVENFKDDISRISTEATQEASLEGMLKKINDKWVDIEFTVLPFKELKDAFILGGVDEIIAALEDSMVTMSVILASRFVTGIRAEVDKLNNQLRLFSDTLDEWLECQKQWMYLESIFSAADIQRQLPNESKAFFAVDKQFKDIMRRTKDRGNALQAGSTPGWLELFQKSNETLEKVQKNLEDYLETKRMSFPRFYFLSNDELLEILSQTKNVQAVQPHMSKCFDGIKSLDFGEDPKSTDIFGMKSGEGEYVSLGKNLRARGNIEKWLTDVETFMQNSLKRLGKKGYNDYASSERKEWILAQPAQLVLSCHSIHWCGELEACLAPNSENPGSDLETFLEKNVKNLAMLSELVRTDLTKLQRKILVTLITLDVHNRDIVSNLIGEKIHKISDFGWQMQLRFYWSEETDSIIVRQVNAKFVYGYEYLGAQPRLVVTPMTDRCYMTLTGALHLKLGGAPAGPAGTGKTETTKDLGKALGIQCVVFNCGDNLDYKFMGKFFSGLAQCGAWACFDEFNRIDIEVLSVVAQQLLTIQNAMKAGVNKFVFEGREIRLIPCGVFITMNPGYAGRTELPDNLKALFRNVAMMIPDYALVAEVMLFAEGFEDAKTLSRKMVKLYKLSSEQLSQQDHYDFGMRALKSVLVMAGSLKRASPNLSEDITLIRAMRDSNIPKFLEEDCVLFNAIVKDLFPGVEVPANDYGDLKTAIEKCTTDATLQTVDDFILKVIQLYETFNVRFGVMLVGPTGGGKTEIYRMLKAAMTLLRERNNPNESFQKTHTYVFNPKCIKMGELYGEYNLLTNEWTDGLGSTLIRNAVADTKEDKKWVVFDGPVDAIWIENMNTVLDDNCTLCLPNGERIKLNPTTMRMLFEVQDLAVASPATVSRCGMVYVPAETTGWRPYIQTWLAHLADKLLEKKASDSAELCQSLLALFDAHINHCLQYIRKNCREYIGSVDINLVTTVSKVIESLLLQFFETHRSAENNTETVKGALGQLFAFSLVWGVSGNVIETFWEKFDEFAREELSENCSLPPGGQLYDYYINEELEFKPWGNIVKSFEYKSDVPYFQLLVPTLDTTRYSWLMGTFLDVNYSVLFIGESGVGKSAIAMNLLSTSQEKNILPIVANFSAQTTAIDTQFLIESKLEKKRKTRFGAPPGKKFVLFVDDVNMPARETYGAQPPVELLRQFQDFKGFYDRKKLFWKDIEDTVICTACAPPGGGRQEITPRFVRHFALLNVPQPSEEVMQKIFSSICGGFLEDFPPEFKGLLKPMVDSTIEIYNRISTELLPTPTKSHYTFNLRDISKVFQGILLIKPGNCQQKEVLTKLWAHENMRVFHDRLINDEDKKWLMEMMHQMLRGRFSIPESYEEYFESEPIMFGDYLRLGVDREDKVYEEVKELEKVKKLLIDYLDDYNMSSTNAMNLVFFRDAIEHVNRLARVLRQPRGNAMLVGVGGSGKQSLTRFACHMSDTECFQIELKRGYKLNEFREDIKSLYKKAGIDGTPLAFLFTDNQIADESFVEDVNNILNSGEVPGMYTSDEKEKCIADIRQWCDDQGMQLSRDGLYQAFVDRVRDNLHIVLCMSPVGEAFRARCRQFPSLINCCTIDWYSQWPEDALLSVSEQYLANVKLESDEINKAVARACVDVHLSITKANELFYSELRRKYYITPKSYLDLINMYVQLLAEKREEYSISRDRLVNGLNKLKQTNEVVDTMKEELNKLQPILKDKSESTTKLIAEVEGEKAEAEKVKKVVSAEAAEVDKSTAETQAIKDDAQKDLDQALPALEGATKALNALNKGDITEIKGFKNPPPLVGMTMEVVCILLQQKADWDSAKKVLGDIQFINKLIDYDKDNIPEKVLKQIKKYIEDPVFTPDAVAKQSNAAKSLCMWCRAMDTYAKIAKVVGPKREALREAETKLQTMQAALAEKQAQLKEVVDKVDGLQAQLEKSQSELKELKDQADLSEKRLARAGKLTSALGDEAVRWNETAEQIAESMVLLIGDVFNASGYISYLGAFTGSYRNNILADWMKLCKESNIPVSDDFTLQKVCASAVEVREWNIQGLPTDNVSVDNGILVTRGKRWPLMIDPQSQANKWIKTMQAKNGLRTIKLTDANLLRTLENSIRIGSPVLLEDIGEVLDPALDPVLQKQVFKQGNRSLIRIGDSDVDYDENFRFYMTTKMSNPHYLPEICIKVTLINFTVTFKGLEDQLLGDLVRKERPDLEEQKDRLVVSISNDKRQLRDLEDKILKLLKESQGNILDDEVLINTLNNSKLTSGVIAGRVKEAEETEAKINAAREEWRPAPIRGSILYFVIADLALIDPMYQYSLSYFTQLFNYCIDESEKADTVEQRLENLMTYTTRFMYLMVCRGLFEAHKTIYSFLICSSILRQEGTLLAEKWNFFLRGAVGGNEEIEVPQELQGWMTKSAWQNVLGLSASVDSMKALPETIKSNPKAWEDFLRSEEPQNADIPALGEGGIDNFDRVLFTKIFREDSLLFSIQRYIGDNLGKEFTDIPPLNIEEVYKDSNKSTPVIFILSTGADPTGMVQRFAVTKDRIPGERLHIISLGQGQGPIAEMRIRQATETGDWVCLQNCHLAKSWMVRMEQIVEGLQTDPDVHDEFRLWLTSMPAAHFPVPVLQSGIKVTMEPPKGIRANILRSYADQPPAFLDSCTKPAPWKKLVFACNFFHAVIQERRKFGPIGWNKAYDFSNSDLETSMMTLRNFLDEQDFIPWPALVYVTGMINYGGRVTDDLDRRLLMSILAKYYNPEVLDESYKLTPSGIYRVPEEGDLESYQTYIRGLPITDTPDIFGMHDNATLQFQMQESKKVVDVVLSIQPQVSTASGGKSSEDIVAELAKEIEEKMPRILDRENASEERNPFAVTESGQANSLGTVLGQEMDRFNRLIKVLNKSLKDIQMAIQGTIVMSGDIDLMFTRMLNNQVPQLWDRYGYPSLKPLAGWVKDFMARVAFMDDWLCNGEPKSFWLSGLFFPQGFLTGALQNHARKTQIAIDRLNFGFTCTDITALDGLESAPENGVYIHGLFLVCAQFDLEKKMLIESSPGNMFAGLPMIHFEPIENYVPPKENYECPLYKTSVRAGVLSTTGQSTNYVLNLSVPIDPKTNPDFWILQGTAALCALDD
ncbi:heavy chain of dynein [Chloropicon primus]|uniref:Heavy chain of dynein n=1 Tax=Chloropicon primus TaxID=1764295 RepID=A0A5B8MV52_9CHLO|nr:heavy chain of dynein [Chloropicon primus]UPR03444.1 heavy chain of dynein [Chloropicon primus]|eukprot:QDZ24237.1 heavy chain of dynein [Chloropicon primus]